MRRNPPTVDGGLSPLSVYQPGDPAGLVDDAGVPPSDAFATPAGASKADPSVPATTPEPQGPVSAPDLVGMSTSDARRVARLAGLHIEVQEQPAREDLWGQVLSQEPQPGVEVVAGGVIAIEIGGRPHVMVPDLRGRDESEATTMLRAMGLAAERRGTRRSDKVPEGHVLRTWPRADTGVAIGSRVAYVVAVGPRVKPGRARRESAAHPRWLPAGRLVHVATRRVAPGPHSVSMGHGILRACAPRSPF